jgi:tRNA pseudouridine38-40 synthase
VTPPHVNVKNIRLVIEYDGTDFCGWQMQPKVRTVEGVLVQVLNDLLGSEPELIAAGRTDSGVHALGQVANFSSVSAMRASEIRNALNSLLPADVRIIDAREVPLAFNARFDARMRTYRYEIALRPTSVWRKHRWFVKYELDVEAMRGAAASITGSHDFSAFTCKDEERNPWIDLKEASIEDIQPQGLGLKFAANRFLRRMVRLLTGTIVEVGRGKLEPAAIYDILSSQDRNRAGPCAPPHGLYLAAVEY